MTFRAQMKEQPTVSDIVEQIGFGFGQKLTCFIANGLFFAEGLELVMVSFLAPSIAVDLKVVRDPGAFPNEGFVPAMILAGALAGHLFSGLCADRVGRQPLIILAYAFVLFFSVASSFMNSLFTIAFLRFFVGFGFGLGQPAAVALTDEVTPKDSRYLATACSWLFMLLGALLAVLLVLCENVTVRLYSPLEWRLLLRCALGPVVFFGLSAVFFLPESPSFLAAHRDNALARDMLGALRDYNGRPAVDVLFRLAPPDERTPRSQQPFTTSMCVSIFGLGAIYVILNFALYGASYGLPQVIKSANLMLFGRDMHVTFVLFLALLVASAVLVCATSLALKVNRCMAIALSLGVSAFGTVTMHYARNIAITSLSHAAVITLNCAVLYVAPAFGMFYCRQKFLSVCPEPSVSTISFCLSIGRVGAILAPLAFDWFLNWRQFFVLAALLEFVGVAVTGICLVRTPPKMQEDQEGYGAVSY